MTCSVKGCNKPSRYKGMCTTHYKRWWRHGDPTKTLTPTRGFERIKCVGDNDTCEKLSEYSCGLCEAHYQMHRVYGRADRITREYGTGTISNAGYIIHTVDGKRVGEHVLVAEKALGKPLPKGAIVHHVNGKPWDNFTPFNLVVCPNQEYHLLLHRRAKELGYENN